MKPHDFLIPQVTGESQPTSPVPLIPGTNLPMDRDEIACIQRAAETGEDATALYLEGPVSYGNHIAGPTVTQTTDPDNAYRLRRTLETFRDAVRRVTLPYCNCTNCLDLQAAMVEADATLAATKEVKP